jgi:hypothetical protein
MYGIIDLYQKQSQRESKGPPYQPGFIPVRGACLALLIRRWTVALFGQNPYPNCTLGEPMRCSRIWTFSL